MKKIQQLVKEFVSEYNLETSVEVRMLDLISEAGETAKEIIKMTDYGQKKPQYRPETEEEIGDLLFSLVALSNSLDIDLAKSLDTAMNKYKKRLEKGAAGSEND